MAQGPSINDITDEEWEYLKDKDTIGFAAFPFSGKKTKYYFSYERRKLDKIWLSYMALHGHLDTILLLGIGDSIKHASMSNINVVSKKEKHFFGTIKDAMKNDYHTTSSENIGFQNGNVCVGCHSHKKNKAKLNVCSTNVSNELDKANCVSCHMPKVAGSVSNKRETKEHSFHGFPGAHSNQEMLAKYVELEFLNNIGSFDIAVNNKSSHALMLHPLRLMQLRVSIKHNSKIIDKFKPEVFVRVIGKDGKPTPPWIANSIVKNTMVQANEKRVVKYKKDLKKGDEVHVTLGYFLVKPKALKKFGLQDDKVAKKFYTLKKEVFKVK